MGEKGLVVPRAWEEKERFDGKSLKFREKSPMKGMKGKDDVGN